ncbi:hypothetical protein GGI35DRAFT_476430 [Trichoderma velutinum]
MALGSSFASLMAELRAIESQFTTESPRKDMLQHREDIQNVTMTFARPQDTLQATRQACEKPREGSSAREERTHQEPRPLGTLAEDGFSRARQKQQEMVLHKMKAAAREPWFGVNGRRHKPPQSSHSNFPETTVQFVPEKQQEQAKKKERKSQKEPEEDDWIVVAEDFGVLVFLDDY